MRLTIHVEFPKLIADGSGHSLSGGHQENRNPGYGFRRLLAVCNLADQGEFSSAAFVLHHQIEREIPGLIESLLGYLALGAGARGERLTESVVDQACKKARQAAHLFRPLQRQNGLGATYGGRRWLVLGFRSSDCYNLPQQVDCAPAGSTAGRKVRFHGCPVGRFGYTSHEISPLANIKVHHWIPAPCACWAIEPPTCSFTIARV
ncbi:MAG: hypothetical protein ACE5IP_02060 [Terriglobia bacterium]